MKREDIKKYYEHLVDIYQRNVNDIAMNKDRAHNVMVMKLMLENSDHIRMYCGEMSVFRDGFYNHISENNKDDNAEDLGEYLKESLIDSMTSFLNKPDCQLEIILEQKVDKVPEDLIFGDEFTSALAEGKVCIYCMDDRYDFKGIWSHFAVSNDIIRMEKDSKAHTAICAIHPTDDIITKMQGHFGTLKNLSNPLMAN